MANSFSKEERVAFENILEGFQDALVLSRNVSVYNTDQAMMERANNTIWRPMPYIAESINAAPGTDISGSYKNMTQLSVPINNRLLKVRAFHPERSRASRCPARGSSW
jgi:hypothetical protein